MRAESGNINRRLCCLPHSQRVNISSTYPARGDSSGHEPQTGKHWHRNFLPSSLDKTLISLSFCSSWAAVLGCCLFCHCRCFKWNQIGHMHCRCFISPPQVKNTKTIHSILLIGVLFCFTLITPVCLLFFFIKKRVDGAIHETLYTSFDWQINTGHK